MAIVIHYLFHFEYIDFLIKNSGWLYELNSNGFSLSSPFFGAFDYGFYGYAYGVHFHAGHITVSLANYNY